ncbi:hypothetical protein Ddc_21889 [Ditylenchus destructor]|nr:hypothetical protein Ddc_21889 [Ditylenchus destructor]
MAGDGNGTDDNNKNIDVIVKHFGQSDPMKFQFAIKDHTGQEILDKIRDFLKPNQFYKDLEIKEVFAETKKEGPGQKREGTMIKPTRLFHTRTYPAKDIATFNYFYVSMEEKPDIKNIDVIVKTPTGISDALEFKFEVKGQTGEAILDQVNKFLEKHRDYKKYELKEVVIKTKVTDEGTVIKPTRVCKYTKEESATFNYFYVSVENKPGTRNIDVVVEHFGQSGPMKFQFAIKDHTGQEILDKIRDFLKQNQFYKDLVIKEVFAETKKEGPGQKREGTVIKPASLFLTRKYTAKEIATFNYFYVSVEEKPAL